MPSNIPGKTAISAYLDNDTYDWIRRVQAHLESERDMSVSISVTIGHVIKAARKTIELPNTDS